MEITTVAHDIKTPQIFGFSAEEVQDLSETIIPIPSLAGSSSMDKG